MKKLVNLKLQDEEKKIKKKCVLCTFLNSFYSLLLVFFAFCSKKLINNSIDGKNFIIWIVLIILTGVLIPVLKGFISYFTNSYADKKITVFRSILFENLMEKDSLQLEELKNGEILNRLMSDSRGCVTYYTSFIPQVLSQIIQLLASFALILIIKPFIGLAILCLGLLAFIIMFFARKLLKKEEKKVLKSYDEVTSFISEGIESTEILKVVADKQELSNRLNKKQSKYIKDIKTLRILNSSSSSLFSLSVQLISVALIIFGAIKLSSNELSYGDFAALIELVALFKSPVSALSGVGNSLASFDASRERINSLLSVENSSENFKFDLDEINSIEFKNVSFSYKNEQIFTNYSTTIELNCFSKFSGNSGKGKTTLFKLLMGIYKPNEGEILLNFKDGKSVEITSYQIVDKFAYVPQSCLIFSGSIIDNLRLANPSLSENDARAILAKVNLENFDLNYQIKENMEGLSRGEAQRLCIGRAVASNRPILLLDEATSSLDDSNTKDILLKLTKDYKTIIFASHKEEDLKGINFKDIKI